MWTDEALKQKVQASLDLYEFLDAIDMSFEELVENLWKELNDEQKEELTRATEF